MKSTFIFRGARFSVREYDQGAAYDIADALTGEAASLTGDDAIIFNERLYGLARRFPGMALDAIVHRAVEGAPMEAR